MIRNHSPTSGETTTSSQQNATEILVSTLAAGDDADLVELIEMFVGELPDRIKAIEKAIDAGDYDALKTLAHQLTGSAGSYGFPTITAAARLLETSAKSGEQRDTLRLQTAELGNLCSRATATIPIS